jgi:hypothetical protein
VPTFTWGYWTSGYNWSTQYGYTYVIFPPLFGHQYSHCWVDFRIIQDEYMRIRGITYHENSRRATLAAREYCIANPLGWAGYGPDLWGLTASDDPDGYLAHGAPPGQNDNGTITPTAAASSIVFAPEVVTPALHNMYDVYGSMLWGRYGFKDAFNLSRFWWGTDWIGIDQGPIVIMIENHLTGAVWRRNKGNEDLMRGLSRAGFTGISSVPDDGARPLAGLEVAQNTPNPFRGVTTIAYRAARAGRVTLRVYDVRGRCVRTVTDEAAAGSVRHLEFDAGGLPSGIYSYCLEFGNQRQWKTCTIIK